MTAGLKEPARAALVGLMLLSGVTGTREAAAADASRPSASLRVAGSSTMCPMIAGIAKRFEEVRPGVKIDVECGGSDRGIKDLGDGVADIAMVSRTLKEEEKGFVNFPMARDGVSVIVNSANPVKTLTPEQVTGIFSGVIASWRQVGGSDAPIAVVLREEQKPVTELFVKHFKLERSLRGKVIPGDNPVTIEAVAAGRDTIGYLSSGEAERAANAGAKIRPLPLGGVAPTARNIITGNYPVTRPLTLATKGPPLGLSKEFIDYCLSPKVVDLVESFGFVPYED